MNDYKVSVIMGIFNCEKTLGAAIECIINQTYKNWKLIMCDDCSSDDTYRVAQEYKKKYPLNIVLLKNQQNMGLNYTLNKCLGVVDTEFVARMDGDDLCSVDRFEKEIRFLENNPNIDFVSCFMSFFDEKGEWGKISHPQYPTKKDFLKESPFCHAGAMVRTSAYRRVDGYSESPRLLRVEDTHLWYKMYKAGMVGSNIPEYLYQMRDDREANKRRLFKYRVNEAYVKYLIVNGFRLSPINYIYVLKPIVIGLLPDKVYFLLHKKSLGGRR